MRVVEANGHMSQGGHLFHNRVKNDKKLIF